LIEPLVATMRADIESAPTTQFVVLD